MSLLHKGDILPPVVGATTTFAAMAVIAVLPIPFIAIYAAIVSRTGVSEEFFVSGYALLLLGFVNAAGAVLVRGRNRFGVIAAVIITVSQIAMCGVGGFVCLLATADSVIPLVVFAPWFTALWWLLIQLAQCREMIRELYDHEQRGFEVTTVANLAALPDDTEIQAWTDITEEIAALDPSDFPIDFTPMKTGHESSSHDMCSQRSFILRGGGIDESPSRHPREEMAAQHERVRLARLSRRWARRELD